eukprot:TRINITY_DN3748_c0_g1_i1.p1 TRINITY_DN3748_c0_g1~~TRINITY_DN3748_c0_g1_i1.p1  ORF type:complete len:650 (+),score=78.83 TRINITY_DN3748_c0_g1_i1:288-1952(+)
MAMDAAYEAQMDTTADSNAEALETDVEMELYNVSMPDLLRRTIEQKRENAEEERIMWGEVPTEKDLRLVYTTIVCNIIGMIFGMLLCYANVAILFVAPASTIVVVHFRRLGQDIHRYFYYALVMLCCATAICAVIGFSASFWLYPDVVGSLKLWAITTLPATYPFFIAYTGFSSYLLIRLLHKARSTLAFANETVTQAVQSVTRHSKISRKRVVTAAEDEASITCYIHPDVETRQHLVNDVGLEPHTLSSCFDPNELARVEFKHDHTAIVIKLPQVYRAQDSYFFKVDSAGLFLFKSKLLIVMHDSFPLFEGRMFTTVDTLADVVIRLIYRSVFLFEEHLKLINTTSEKLEIEVEKATNNSKLLNLFTLEKSLVYYLNGTTAPPFLNCSFETFLRSRGHSDARLLPLSDCLERPRDCASDEPCVQEAPLADATESCAARGRCHRKQPVSQDGPDLLAGHLRADGRTRLNHQQQSQRDDEEPQRGCPRCRGAVVLCRRWRHERVLGHGQRRAWRRELRQLVVHRLPAVPVRHVTHRFRRVHRHTPLRAVVPLTVA